MSANVSTLKDSATGAGTGAAIGTVILPGLGTVVGSVVDVLSSILPGLRGKTPHMGFINATAVAEPLSISLANGLQSGLPNSIPELIAKFPMLAANAIDSSNWWKVGNDQIANVPIDIRSENSTFQQAVKETIWRVAVWALMNTPTDNLLDAYSAMSEIFVKSLYLITDKYNPSVKYEIDNAIAAICDTKSTLQGSTTPSNATPANPSNTNDGIIPAVTGFISSLFDGSKNGTTNSAGSTVGATKLAGLSLPAVTMISGAVLFIIYNIIKKGKPF